MTQDNTIRWLLKVLLFTVVTNILILTCCHTDSPADEPLTYSPQVVPTAGYMAGCPQPGKWAVSTWSGPTTEILTALTTCGVDTVDTAYYLDPTTNGWKAYFRNRPEITRLHEVFHMQGLITYGAPTPPPPPAPEVYWLTLLDGEITVSSEPELEAWVTGTIEAGWQIEVTYVYDDSADLRIATQEEIIFDGKRACGLAASGSGICYVTLNDWCFEQEPNFIYEDVPEKVLLHEVGHCMGLSHREWGVMVTPIHFSTTEEDIEEIHTTYGLR